MLAASALALIVALLSDPEKKPSYSMSDLDLWDLVRSGASPFQDKSFQECLERSPIFIEAWIQQPAVRGLVSALQPDLVADVRLDEIAKYAFCERNSELRKQGPIGVPALAESTRVSFEAILELLASLFVTQRSLGSEVRDRLFRRHADLANGLHGSADLAHQAASFAPEGDRDAWADIAQSYGSLAEAVELLFRDDPEEFGGDYYGLAQKILESWRVPSGHRAPYGEFAKAQYLQMGGRAW